MHRTTSRFISVSACALVSGCASESLGTNSVDSSGELATIFANSRIWRWVPDAMTAAASINSVDGQKTKANTTKVTVHPGHHVLSVTCRYGVSYKTEELQVEAKPGAKYGVGAELSGGSCQPIVGEAQ